MIHMEDYRRGDGSVDWERYRAAQVAAGEICSRCHSYRAGLSAVGPALCWQCRALDAPEAVDHDSFVRCPKCGESWDPSDYDDREVYADGEHELSCVECGHAFEVTTHVSFSFSSPAREK